jgi:pilus assembly protein CpaB
MVFGLVLVAGLALAGFAVYMVQGFVNQNASALQQERAKLQKIGNLVEVYVVNKPLKYGDALTKDDVQKIYWPENALPENAFSDEAVLFPGDGAKPRYVMRQMEKFEPVLAVKVTEPGEQAGLTARLGKGMRAYTIKVDATSGAFLNPGEIVDVYWTGSVDGNIGEITRSIESSVSIIAVDQSTNGDRGLTEGVPSTVTVEASPQQVARLAQAQATGRITLSLVGVHEEAATGKVEVNSQTLLGMEKQEVAAVVTEKVCTVMIRKGAEAVPTTITCPN